MSATAVSSVSVEPPALLVCINNATSTHRALNRSGRFCLNVLRSSQSELCKVFGGKIKGDDRFRVGDWRMQPNGSPFLFDAQANLFCQLDQVTHYHTHTIFVARVYSITHSNRSTRSSTRTAPTLLPSLSLMAGQRRRLTPSKAVCLT
jgi:flavin reductase (DIM6/NTAB) family NADH-FMN oxidoreductase RutF